ncbi:redoxin domain-containing protein [Micromonospora sagamiensis]|uniref:Thiol-disulfide isomerase/thioredoxin n=1 Tax=Micromonospora sagamiensis TaxID=47875 RepID=A0A562WES0_9ACTN|nr:redoxin domain-containing protein [Micromonospora sagamiensis]TWJ28551.1 thiol-disulfide isomerase/thioredoxin [Micromonospora sagamiensis]BCL12547.1 thiol:disulfide interchange protein [Micromonospora sagamiensis]
MPGPRAAFLSGATALTAAVFALAACGGNELPAASGGGTAASSAAAQPTTSGTVGPAASDGTNAAVPETISFTGRTIDGGVFSGSSLAGKPVVLWFWAAWCTRCRAVADEVAAVQRENVGRVNVVGVAGLGSGDEAMRRFAKETGIEGFPNLADDGGQVWRRFEVTSQEQYVLLDSAGTVVHSGPLSQSDLRRRVAGLS